jgi:hypothetical protein
MSILCSQDHQGDSPPETLILLWTIACFHAIIQDSQEKCVRNLARLISKDWEAVTLSTRVDGIFPPTSERINSSRKAINQAIKSTDAGFICSEARAQAEAGAHYIDVNAGSFLGQEAEYL